MLQWAKVVMSGALLSTTTFDSRQFGSSLIWVVLYKVSLQCTGAQTSGAQQGTNRFEGVFVPDLTC